ncbi:hypothetical protein FACS1894217_11530 [Clostridia bacterium]|nr:hypothetical protein FACS1894217_11530 [Clostridia bacterium]
MLKSIARLAVALVMALSLVACSTKAVDVKSPADFPGARIAVQTETTASDSIAEMNDKTIQTREFKKVTQCFDDLKLGRVDAVYVDVVVADYYTNGNPDFKKVWTSTDAEPIGICFAKKSVDLSEAVEAAIDTLYFNGKIAELSNKFFGRNVTEGLRNVTEAPVIPDNFTLKTAGKLQVGMEIGYPPMEFTTEDGKENIGFDVELAGEIAKLLGLELELRETAWDGIFSGLEKGDYDCIISSVSITPPRQEAYILTKPYIANSLCIVVKA